MSTKIKQWHKGVLSATKLMRTGVSDFTYQTLQNSTHGISGNFSCELKALPNSKDVLKKYGKLIKKEIESFQKI